MKSIVKNTLTDKRHATSIRTLLRAAICALTWFCAGAAVGQQWNSAGGMVTARTGHTATWLQTGQLLVAGGEDGNYTLASAEIFDPAKLFDRAPTWMATGSMQTSRVFHTATLLPSGKVLVAGGRTITATNAYDVATAELYDPATGQWTPTGSMNVEHAFHTATLLATGDVLVVGAEFATAVELYDWKTETWTTTSPYSNRPITDHTATLMPDGRVLVVGGFNVDSAGAALYDPSTGQWVRTGALNTNRAQHVAILLPNGLVLVTGGRANSNDIAAPELYDISSGTWKSISGDTNAGALRAAVLLDSGRVLIVGGADTGAAVIYDSASNQWTSTPRMLYSRAGHTATKVVRVDDGVLDGNERVLVAGGGPELSEDFRQFDTPLLRSPVISFVTPVVSIGERIGIEGQMFRGQSEGSGGNGSRNSPTGYPTLLIISDSPPYGFRVLGVDSVAGWTDTTFTSTPLVDFPTGDARVYLISNGALSQQTWHINIQSKPAVK
jgi:hypothetical protein